MTNQENRGRKNVSRQGGAISVREEEKEENPNFVNIVNISSIHD